MLESRKAIEARGGRAIAAIDSVSFARSTPADFAAAIASVIRAIGSPANLLSSAAGMRLDEIEAAALRVDGVKTVSSIYGHVAETFSATPLVGIAATIAAKSLPRLLGSPCGLGDVSQASGDQPIDQFGAICTDPTGLATGVRMIVL